MDADQGEDEYEEKGKYEEGKGDADQGEDEDEDEQRLTESLNTSDIVAEPEIMMHESVLGAEQR